jgi:hypothetical protein
LADTSNSVTVTCRDCPATRTITLKQAKRQAYKNKYFDLSARKSLCRSCVMRRWHLRYKKKAGSHGHRDMLTRRIKQARKSLTADHRALGAAARRGATDSSEVRGWRVLRRMALQPRWFPGRFFICRWCGRLSSCRSSEAARYGFGCIASVRKSDDWGPYIRRRSTTDPTCDPPGEFTSRRSSDTLKEDFLVYLEHDVLQATRSAIATRHHITEEAIKKSLARCREILPETWGHVFPESRALRSLPVDFIKFYPLPSA